MDNLSFIKRYEALLREKGIKKGQFYNDCQFTDAAVSQWRNGKTSPSMRTIERMAEYLSTTPEYLLTGIKEEEPAASDELSEKKRCLIEAIKQMDDRTIDALNTLADSIIQKRDK